ncbi:MAG: pilus assembly protein [Acidimicrobiia bacterium]|nr:pilus assembly protein [Acidimicrobiia bacterium]MDH4306907.1 pilus assembly protein [Acidimicrobiia bacterium]MDH5293590.1 pilus assembly protein [Acidimicrobiia bacterium]
MERGSLTVETALVIPVIVIVLVAVVEVIAVIGTQLDVAAAAREGARVAATSPDPADAVAAARRVLGDDGASAVVSVTRPGVVGRMAEVVVTYRKTLVTPLLGGLGVTLRSRAVMRVEL